MRTLIMLLNDRLSDLAGKVGDWVGNSLLKLGESRFSAKHPRIYKIIFYGTFRVACLLCRESWSDHEKEIHAYYFELTNKNTLLNRYLDGVD